MSMDFDTWWDDPPDDGPPPAGPVSKATAQWIWGAAVAAERERCATLARNKALHCDDHENHYGANAARDIEDAIRGPNEKGNRPA